MQRWARVLFVFWAGNLVSTTDGERDLLPCCRALVDLPLHQAPGFTLRLAFDRDWARR